MLHLPRVLPNNSRAMSCLVAVGRVGKLFGVKGELTLSLYDTFPDDFNIEEPVFVKIDALTVPLFFDRFSPRGCTGATVVFADIDNTTRASEMIGKELFLNLGNTENSDEFFMEDLVGFAALLGEGNVGRIVEFFDDTTNPLFEISLDGRMVLIPAADDFIKSFDLSTKTVTFVLPEGLLTIN